MGARKKEKMGERKGEEGKAKEKKSASKATVCDRGGNQGGQIPRGVTNKRANATGELGDVNRDDAKAAARAKSGLPNGREG